MRIGHGYDTHRLRRGIPLILGGVTIPHAYGLEAHSDGDAVIHALCDALLGAAGLGDIGNYYPDTDPEFADIDSRVLLRDIAAKLRQRGHRLVNADITIVAQAPKLAQYMEAMKKNLAADLQSTPSALNIKATTNEKMGFVGRGEGMAVYAVALLEAQ